MIDLTPLDVRNKRGDFKKKLGGGYDPAEVDIFLELVAERLEAVVRENLQFRERSETLQRQVASQSGREQAVQEALVTAQELRADIRDQAQREADHLLKEAETEGRRLVAEAQAEVRRMVRDAERRLEQGQDALLEMERRRNRFLKSFRQLLEREMDVVQVEEERAPLEDRPIDLDLGGSLFAAAEPPSPAPVPELATTPPAVDTDPAERPPLDAPVDELTADYGDAGTEGSQPAGDEVIERATILPAPEADAPLEAPPIPEPSVETDPPREGESLLFSFESEEPEAPAAPDEDPRLY